MSQVELSHEAVFTASLRPARAVYLIEQGSRGGFRRAVQAASVRWGGACEPIIEVDDAGKIDDWVRQVVEVSGVDGVVNVDAEPALAAAVADSLDLRCADVERIDLDGLTALTCHPRELGLPPTVDGSNGYVVASANPDLWQVAVAGDTVVEAPFWQRDDLLVVRKGMGSDDVARSLLWGHTLIEQTVARFGEQYVKDIMGLVDHPTVVWITSKVGELTDCIGFWNLRALRPLRYASAPMYLLPGGSLKDWRGFPRQFADQLKRPGSLRPDVLLTSKSADQAALHEAARVLGLEADSSGSFSYPATLMQEEWTGEVRTAPFTYRVVDDVSGMFMFERAYGETSYIDVPVVRETVTLKFPSPVPFISPGIVATTFAGSPFDPLPKEDCVAELIYPACRWRNGGAQVLLPRGREMRVALRIPSLATAAYAILGERTDTYCTSGKGAIGQGLLSEEATDALAEPGILNVIQYLTTPRTSHMAKALQDNLPEGTLSQEQLDELAATWGGRRDRMFKSAAKLGGGDQTCVRLERIAGIGWAERGLAIVCRACRLTSFLLLSAVSDRGPARCPGCNAVGEYIAGEDGPVLQYRLDSRIDHASDQGVLPHLVTIAALKGSYTSSWFCPGVDMWFPDLENKREADIFGIADAKIISGEVKANGNDFTKEGQIEKDIDIAVRLRADVYVMAAMTNIPNPAVTEASRLCTDNGLDITVLQPADLNL